MIKTPTTFVIGAGASVPYQLPVARTLRVKACALDSESDIFQLIIRCGVSAVDLKDFLQDLRQNHMPSIDSFLATRQKEPSKDKVGRKVLAALMGDAVSKIKMNQPPAMDDWIGYVIERMLEGAHDHQMFIDGNANVRFVTFNFDTIIEERLSVALRGTYPNGSAEALAAIPIIHVHGKLPLVPDAPIGPPESGRKYEEWMAWLNEAAPAINVTLDAISPETLDQARAAVEQGLILCFLGFAYDPDNLNRLDLPKLSGGHNVYGSAYDLDDGEQEKIKRNRLDDRIVLGRSNEKCLDVLRRLYVFRE